MNVYRRRLAAHLRGHGIEIGALHLPLEVPPRASVTYVDRMSVDDLKRQYVELAGEELTHVDVIGSAEDLSAFPDDSLDFVIANHLIEHLEDPIGGLKEFHRVLKPRGLLFLCVPDARATFDRYRELTSIDHLLAEHRDPARVKANHRLHYEDWVANVLVKWQTEQGQPLQGDPDEHLEHLLGMNYSIHFHCWHADTFLRFFAAAAREADLRFTVLAAVDTVPMGLNELVLLAAKDASLGQRLRIHGMPSAKHWLKRSPAGPLLTRAYRKLRRR